jgi:Family of unknown function (DUF5670)
MPRTILVILAAFWLPEFVVHAAGSPIHLLLGIALAVMLVDIIVGKLRVQ